MTRARAETSRRAAPEAIVVGAGVVGAATALGLAQAGLRVAVVEARAPRAWEPEAERDLRVFALAPASSALLQRLGAWDTIRARRAHPYREMRIWDAGGGGGDELHFAASAVGVEALGHIVEQAAIQTALWQALERHERVALHVPACVRGLQREVGAIRLELDDGAELSAPLIVAADGADSPLRAMAGLDVEGRAYEQRGLVAYVQTERAHGDTAWQHFLPGGPLALLPCSEALASIVWTLPEAEAQRLLACEVADFEQALTRAFDRRLGAMRLASARAAFPLRMQLARRYVADGVVLVGDAAHVVHPLAGQGVNLGLQDAEALLDGVARARAAGRRIDDRLMLRRYERVRRSENAIAARSFDAIHRLFSSPSLLPSVVRGPALGWVDRIAPLKRMLARHAMGLARR